MHERHDHIISGWEVIDNKLYRKFLFKDFNEALGFIIRVALLAEQADHHPEWHNIYNSVEIWLTTHDKDNTITDKDRNLANAINQLRS